MDSFLASRTPTQVMDQPLEGILGSFRRGNRSGAGTPMNAPRGNQKGQR